MKITPYTLEDNEAALDLEEQCVQGESIVLTYRRPTFHARSQVYDKYRILCAKIDNRLVGITQESFRTGRIWLRRAGFNNTTTQQIRFNSQRHGSPSKISHLPLSKNLFKLQDVLVRKQRKPRA